MLWGAEGTAGHLFFYKYLSTGQQSYPQGYPQAGQGVEGRCSPRKITPPTVKYYLCMYNTPQQKIYAKVKCPILYTYF